jgi:hypothetical protein
MQSLVRSPKTLTEENPKHEPAKQRLPRHAVAYYCSVAVLLIGLTAAAFVYVLADGEDLDDANEIANARMYQHNLEVIGGKFAVYLDEFNRWFASLWHGKTLAYTIGVLAIALALVCFWIGDMISRHGDGA